LADQLEQVLADMVGAELIGGTMELLSERGYHPDVDILGVGGQVPHLHVIDHSLP
jgi:hypothetical protein